MSSNHILVREIKNKKVKNK